MTDERKFIELLKEMGELLMQKNNYLNMKEFQIERLESKLTAAEKELAELRQAKQPSLDALNSTIADKHERT